MSSHATDKGKNPNRRLKRRPEDKVYKDIVPAIASGRTVTNVNNRYTVIKTDGAFLVLVQAFKWKFWLAPGFTQEQVHRWSCLNLPTTTDLRQADIILLPARPGQSSFTLYHETLLRFLHTRPKPYPGIFKPFARKMEWVDACLMANKWLRDKVWEVKLEGMPGSDEEHAADLEREAAKGKGKGQG